MFIQIILPSLESFNPDHRILENCPMLHFQIDGLLDFFDLKITRINKNKIYKHLILFIDNLILSTWLFTFARSCPIIALIVNFANYFFLKNCKVGVIQ